MMVKGGEIQRRLDCMGEMAVAEQQTLQRELLLLWFYMKLNYQAFVSLISELDMVYHKPTLGAMLVQRLYRHLLQHWLSSDHVLTWAISLGQWHRQLHLSTPPTPPTLLHFSSSSSSSSSSSATSNTSDMPHYGANAITGPPLASPTNIQSPPEPLFYTPLTSFQPDAPLVPPPMSFPASPNPSYSTQRRHRRRRHHSKHQPPPTPAADHRPCYKFWLHPNHLLELTLYLSKYMSLSDDCPVALSEVEQHPETQQRKKKALLWQPITTLHLDTPDWQDYSDQLLLTAPVSDGDAGLPNLAQAIRLRRYHALDEPLHREHDPHYALEKKIYSRSGRLSHPAVAIPYKQLGKLHRPASSPPGWTMSALHCRAWFKANRLVPWLTHQWSLQTLLNKASPLDLHYKEHGKPVLNKIETDASVLEIEHDLHTRQLRPRLITSCRRLQFTYPTLEDPRQQVVVTIDTDTVMEEVQTHQRQKKLTRLAFCVVQISLPHTDHALNALPWIDHLLSCPLLEPVPGFSVYLHGVSTLFPEKIHVFPDWLGKLEMDLRRDDDRGCLGGDLRSSGESETASWSLSSQQDLRSGKTEPRWHCPHAMSSLAEGCSRCPTEPSSSTTLLGSHASLPHTVIAMPLLPEPTSIANPLLMTFCCGLGALSITSLLFLFLQSS
ncbi:hypothetical protein DM01DRAFT_1126743 [Hesseltinella vesiculosa]|uniref:VTC domain-containing protein n=1 Tax=Hesseltinella vesiculosa TaxID=101127 RepID=A0A1X2GUF2_9FUNG|nr:hypothetical protein DM01DRAFT_1126743 [Hesseltinella vesiculosa]